MFCCLADIFVPLFYVNVHNTIEAAPPTARPKQALFAVTKHPKWITSLPSPVAASYVTAASRKMLPRLDLEADCSQVA